MARRRRRKQKRRVNIRGLDYVERDDGVFERDYSRGVTKSGGWAEALFDRLFGPRKVRRTYSKREVDVFERESRRSNRRRRRRRDDWF